VPQNKTEADLHIYLVEPSAVQARIIAGALRNLGVHDIEIFDTGAAVLSAMRHHRPDAVVSAYYLPDMTGTDLIHALRDDPAQDDVAFLLVSSETRPQALNGVRQSGACAILPKPFTDQQLSRALVSTLDYLQADRDFAESDLEPGKLRVLIVDDSSSSRHFIRRVLGNLGVEHFLEAENGVQAIAVLSDTAVDLVVTDYHMPEMDGRSLVEYIRKQSWQAEVPILMVTSEDDMSRLAAVEEAGVSGICDKPFETDTIRNLLGRMLAGRP
jgi:two-component system chemotaxis response regulator CheY